MSTQSVNRGINIFIESGDAQKSVDKLQAKFNDLKTQIANATDPKVITRLNTELNKISEPLDRAQKKLSGQLAPSLKDLGNTIKTLSNELSHLSASDAGYEKKVLQLRQANLAYAEQSKIVKGLNQEHTTLSGKLGEFAKELVAPLVALAAVEKAVEFLRDSVDAALEKEQNIARFKSTLDNIGRSDAFNRLTASAEKFSQRFKYIQEDDFFPVFEKLIDYGKLTEKQINTLTPIIVNFAAKQRISLEEATDVITKGLEGSGKALKTYGINIKDAKDESERFAIITDVLGKKVEGAAEAFGETTQGKIAETKKNFKELKEEVGTGLLPVLNGLLNAIKFIGIGFADIGDKAVNAFLKITNPTAFALKQLEESQKKIKENAEEFASDISEELGKLDISDLTTRKIEEQANIDRIKKLLHSRNKIFDDADKDYLIQAKANSEKILEQIKIQEDALAGRKLGADVDNKPKKNTAKDFSVDDEEAKLLDRIKKALTEDSDIFTKKITEINIQLDDLLRGAKKKLDAYLADENTTQAQRNAAQKEYNKLYVDVDAQRWAEIAHQLEEADKQSDKATKNRTERQLALQRQLDNARLEAFAKQQEAVAALVARRAKLELGEYNAEDELAVIKSRGKARLDATVKQLKDQEEIELAGEDVIGAKREVIEKKYDKLIQDARTEYFKNIIATVSDYISTGITALNNFYNISNAKAQAEIDADTKINDRKKKNYQAQLDGKLITQSEYQKKVDKLDKEVADKERALRIKQFNQNRLTSIAQASINVAEAVTKAFTAGPVAGQVLAGITAALGAVEIAFIAAQKAPTYGKGGKLIGPLHSEGGMPIINPRTGRKVAEVEGGEPILSRNTYANNRGIVDALLYNSMYKNGAPLQASWKSAAIPQLNFPALQRSMTRFATGGILPGGSQASDENNAVQLGLLHAISNLNDQLAAGIKAPISLYDINRQQTRLNKIIADASS